LALPPRIKRGVSRLIVELHAAIKNYLAEHNRDSQSFVWTNRPTRSSPK
jgi:hypothetical protein